jgi:transposase-like protein
MYKQKYTKTRACLYCGKDFIYPAHASHRKYCSRQCGSRATYNKGNANTLNKVWGHDKEIFDAAMEMYWSGLGGSEIARHFAIPNGTVYSWIHDFGAGRVRAEPEILPKVIRPKIKSVKERFKEAGSADEWLGALREKVVTSEETFVDLSIRLVCGTLHGQSAGKLAAVIAEGLKENPLSGRSYAFCNKGWNTITVIAWRAPIYELSKYVKTHGTFIWPGENLGRTIEVTRAEFESFLFIKKQGDSSKCVESMRFSCYN